jgi:hypothetical protein
MQKIIVYVLLVLVGLTSCAPAAPVQPLNPGWGIQNMPGGGISADSVTITAGKATSLDFVYTTKNNGPGKLSLVVFNIGHTFQGGTTPELPMPSGLEVNVNPNELMAYPNHTYHQTISINTSAELTPGIYWLVWQSTFQMGGEITGALTITVEVAAK